MRQVVTFVAKRVTPRRCEASVSGAQGLLGVPAFARASLLRQWLPTALAAFMTVLTAVVGWSALAGLPQVFTDTKAMAREIDKRTRELHHDTQSPEEQKAAEEALTAIWRQEDEALQRRTQLNNESAAIQSDKERAAQRREELLQQQQNIETDLDEPRQKFLAVFGRDIEVREGPPATYDAGPEPKVPFYYPSRSLSAEWRAWRAAKEVCDKATALQEATGIDLGQVNARLATLNQQLQAYRAKLDEAEAVLMKLDQQRRRYTNAPAEAMKDLDALRRQFADTAAVRTAFWLFDIPTLLSCLLTTAIAYTRMLLIAGRFGPRQLARLSS
jgi:hypothetical protein